MKSIMLISSSPKVKLRKLCLAVFYPPLPAQGAAIGEGGEGVDGGAEGGPRPGPPARRATACRRVTALPSRRRTPPGVQDARHGKVTAVLGSP